MWTGKELLDRQGSLTEQAGALFHAPFVVVSHGTEEDPILNFGNQAALTLWETTWEELTNTPSRLTAEPVAQAERARMLAEATEKGYIDHYRGVRISMKGRQFFGGTGARMECHGCGRRQARPSRCVLTMEILGAPYNMITR